MTEPIKCLLHKSNIVSRMILLASVGVLIAGPAWSYEGVSAEVLVKTGETIVGDKKKMYWTEQLEPLKVLRQTML